jgi:hypothetical protein
VGEEIAVIAPESHRNRSGIGLGFGSDLGAVAFQDGKIARMKEMNK